MPKSSKKRNAITAIFNLCKERDDFVFDNLLVKEIATTHEFGNAFDITKIDSLNKLPDILQQEDYFLIHLGGGKHQFVKGISRGYHKFEDITNSETIHWKYRPGILDEADTSESNILSVAANHGVIQHFLYHEDTRDLNIYNSRRTQVSLNYWIGEIEAQLTKTQVEIDMTAELNGTITAFEAKNGSVDNFAIYQLYLPFWYYLHKENLSVEQMTCCYVLRKKVSSGSNLRLYHYTFDDESKIDSIKLLKKAEYQLRKA